MKNSMHIRGRSVMNYKKITYIVVGLVFCFYVSYVKVVELAGAIKEGMEGDLARVGEKGEGGLSDGEITPHDDEGFESGGGAEGGNPAQRSTDVREEASMDGEAPPEFVPAEKGGAGDEGGNLNVDEFAAFAKKDEPRPRANAMSGRERPGSEPREEEAAPVKEEPKLTDKDIDAMGDEDLLKFKAKDGEEGSAELGLAQTNLKKASENFEKSLKDVENAEKAVKDAKKIVEDNERLLEQAKADLKESDEKYFDKAGNPDFNYATTRNGEIKAKLKKEGKLSADEQLESERLNTFLKKNNEVKKAKANVSRAESDLKEKEVIANREAGNLNLARSELKSLIKRMNAARMAAFSAAARATTDTAPREPSSQEQAEHEDAAQGEHEQELQEVKDQIKAKDDEIDTLKARKELRDEVLQKANEKLSKLQGEKDLMGPRTTPEARAAKEREIEQAKRECDSAETGVVELSKKLKKAEEDRTALVEKRDRLNGEMGEPGPKSAIRKSAIRKDLGELRDKISLKGKGTKLKKYWKETSAKDKAIDAVDSTYTGLKKGTKWAIQKTKKFGNFLWEQLKIGFAFMIPGDIVATIQAALQAKAMYKMITAEQNFAGIKLYTIDGLIPREDAANGVFLYTDTTDGDQYTDPNRRFFMSYNNYGDIGKDYLGSGNINYMIEFSTGFIFDGYGDAIIYGYPAIPLMNIPGYNYSGSTSTGSNVTTSVFQALPAIARDTGGGVKREIKVDGLLEGFSQKDSSPEGNSTVSSLLYAPKGGGFPSVFNSSLTVFRQGVTSSKFGMSFKQVEGLGIGAYLLTHYRNIFEEESKGRKVNLDSAEMRLIGQLATGKTLKEVTTLAGNGKYKLTEESFLGVDPNNWKMQLLMGNVFIYQTDDTPIVALMKNSVPAGLKSHVHDYIVGINPTNAVIPLIIPMVNIPAGGTTAAVPVVEWGINPDVTYIVSLVSGTTYCAGGVTVMNNGIPDYTLGNTIWGQVTATSGSNTAYGAIAGLTNQLNAMQQFAQFIVDKGPFNLNGRYKAYRVTGLEDMYENGGITDDQLQKAQQATLLGMAATHSGAKLASADPVGLKDKKSDVANGIFVYRIDNALAGGTLPDYVIPIMVNSSGNYQIVPLGSQAATAKDGSTGGVVSNQVQALVSLVTSRMYDAHYNPLPANYVTDILVFNTPGSPVSCDNTGSYSPYTCIGGNLVEPNGHNQPLFTAFMETEFNPANKSIKEFNMPPYYFLMMPYDIAPLVPVQQGGSVFGNVGAVGTVQTLSDPLYQVLPERFTGIPWPQTIKQNLEIYQKFLDGYSSPALDAIKKSGQSARMTAASQPSDETKILHQLLKTMQTITHSNIFNPSDYTIAQVHDIWKGNLIQQLEAQNPNWIAQWEMGPYTIATAATTLPANSQVNPGPNPITVNSNWSITLLNEECAINSHYLYSLTNNQTTVVNGLWVTAQLDGYPQAVTESSLTSLNVSLTNTNRQLNAINKLYLVDITLPSVAASNTSKALQQNMINYYNLQPRADGNYYGIAPTQAGYMGHMENLFTTVGQPYPSNPKEGRPNALIDLLSGRVLILTQDAANQTYLLPLVNIQGYEITLDPAVILNKFAPRGLDAALSTYIQQNTVGFSGSSYITYFGDKQVTLLRECLDSGNYIYEYQSENPIKPIDYLVGVQSITSAQTSQTIPFFNLPLEQDVRMMISLIDCQNITVQTTADQTPSYLSIKGISNMKDRINYSILDATLYFNPNLLTQGFIDKINAVKKTALDAALAKASAVVKPVQVSEDIRNENAIINYQESQEHSGNYFDPTVLTKNNTTYSGDSDMASSGNFFLYNDANSNYFLGIGEMSGMGDSATFDTYYAFSLQGYMGSSFPSSLTNLQAPVGGYYTKNDAGKYVLTQVVFGPTAQHIASTYGVYVDTKGNQVLNIPLPAKPLFMDPATDTNLQGGKGTGTFMRLLKTLPSVLDGYTYYLYENIAVPGFIPSRGQLGVKMTPSAYLVQINPSHGPAKYVDLMTGFGYDMKGSPLPQETQIYKRSDQNTKNFNPLITWGMHESFEALVPLTHPIIVSSFIANNLAAQGQKAVFVTYGTMLANIIFTYRDPATKKVYGYSRCSTPGAPMDGNVYQFDMTNSKDSILVKTYDSAQLDSNDTSALATSMSKKVTISNQNMLAAIQEASKNGYTPYTLIYGLQPLNLDSSTETNIVLPSITATYNIPVNKWSLNYIVTDPTTSAQSSVTQNYFSTLDFNNIPLYQAILLNAVGSYSSSDVTSGQINLTSLGKMNPDNFNTVQQLRNAYLLNSFNPNTNGYDTPAAIIASGTIFRSTSTKGSFTNPETAVTIAYKQESGQPFMPTFVDPALSKNVVVHTLNPVNNPQGSNFNPSFFAQRTTFVFTPQYVANPQADFTEYFTAWGLEPQITTEGTVAIVDYLRIDSLVPITADKVFIDRNATIDNQDNSSSPVISIQEYLISQYGKTVEPLNKIQDDLKNIAHSVMKSSRTTASTSTIPKTNPYVNTNLAGTGKKQALQSMQQQMTKLRQAAIDNKALQQQLHTQFSNTVWGPVFSAMPPAKYASAARLYYDPVTGYVVYKVGDYDADKDFYAITGITEGYILMPMIFKDEGQGSQQLIGLPSTYRLSGVVFDTDGQTIHEVVSMKDLNAIEKSIGSLGVLEKNRQSSTKIIFDIKVQLPQVQDMTLTSAPTVAVAA